MATYATLKARIAAEMVRDDLGTDYATLLDAHVADAVEAYSSTRFWFNVLRATATTTGGQATVSLPATARVVETVKLGTATLAPVTLDEIPNDGAGGTPTRWANYGDAIYLYPTPTGAETLTLFGLKKIAAPALDADDNVWTTEAARLIAARVRMTLFRDIFFDADRANLASVAVADALAELRRETTRRMMVPMRTDVPVMSSAWANQINA